MADSMEAFCYKETSAWLTGPFPILALLFNCFVVVVFSFVVVAVLSFESLPATIAIESLSLLLEVWVDRETNVGGGLPFFWSFTSNS